MGALAIARGTGHERYDVSNHRHLDCFSPAFSFQYTRGFVSHVIEIVLIICIYGFLEIHLFYFLKFLTHEDRGKMAAISQATFSDAFSWLKSFGFSAATKQLYEWYFLSVCPSVCLSVTPFWLCSHHRIITKFSGVITNDRSDVHAKGQGQRSKVKVTEVTTQLNRFRTVTPVWIHIWWWNHAYDLIILRRGALLFFKVIPQISRSNGSKKRRI